MCSACFLFYSYSYKPQVASTTKRARPSDSDSDSDSDERPSESEHNVPFYVSLYMTLECVVRASYFISRSQNYDKPVLSTDSCPFKDREFHFEMCCMMVCHEHRLRSRAINIAYRLKRRRLYQEWSDHFIGRHHTCACGSTYAIHQLAGFLTHVASGLTGRCAFSDHTRTVFDLRLQPCGEYAPALSCSVHQQSCSVCQNFNKQ